MPSFSSSSLRSRWRATTSSTFLQPRRARRSTVLLSIGTGSHLELLDITRPSRVAYARRHGMRVEEVHDDRAQGRPASWGKIPVILDLFESKQADTVVWVDADAVIVNHSRSIVADCPSDRYVAMVEHRVNGQVVPNFGVFVLRSTPWSLALLREMWSLEQYVHHKWWENAALLDLLGYTTTEPVERLRESVLDNRVAELPLRWNSIPQVPAPSEPAIVHLPGYDHATRVRCLSALAADPSRAAEILRQPSLV